MREIEMMGIGARAPGEPGDRPADAREPAAVTRLGVLGWPVAHSRSPAMHNAALRELGLGRMEGPDRSRETLAFGSHPRFGQRHPPGNWTYQRLPVPPELFAETTRALGAAGFLGANVTIPHKQEALALAGEASTAARAIGAANTLTFAPDGAIAAENTDAPGLIAAMKRAGHSPRGLTALVLGAGGSARAAVWALREAGAREVSVWNRTGERGEQLARSLQARAVELPEPADILINCTSVGMKNDGPDRSRETLAIGEHPRFGQPAFGGLRHPRVVRPASATESDLNLLSLTHDLVGRYSYVVDFVYGVRESGAATELLAVAREQGVPTLDGLELLVAQGALSLELWTGLPVADQPELLEVMRRAAREAPGH